VTFLFTDIEGSTRRWEADAEAMRAAFLEHYGFGGVNKVGVYPVHEATEVARPCPGVDPQPRWCSVEGSSRISAQAVDPAEAAKSRPHSRHAAVRAEQLSVVLSPWLARWTSAHAIANTGTRLRWAAPSSSLNAASESHRRIPIKMPCAVFSMRLLFESEGI
jgi:hypothetical protein